LAFVARSGAERPWHWTARVLDKGGLSVASRESTAAASRAIASGLELSELAFLWARVLAYLRPEHRLVVFYPTALDVAKLLLGSLAAAGVEEAEGDAALVADGISELLEDDVREELALAAEALEKKRLRTRVGKYVRGVHAAAGRAGLIACGDISRAIALVGRFPLESGLTEAEQIADLRAFCISAEHCQIREALGVAVRG